MAVYKQKGSSNWWVSIYQGKNRPRLRMSTGTPDKASALAIEASLKSAQCNPDQVDKLHEALDALANRPVKQSLQLDSVMEVYLGLPAVSLTRGTEKERCKVFRRFLRWIDKYCPNVTTMADVSRDVAFAFMDSVQATGVTGKTYNNLRGELSAIWSALLYRADLKENVWQVVPAANTNDHLFSSISVI